MKKAIVLFSGILDIIAGVAGTVFFTWDLFIKYMKIVDFPEDIIWLPPILGCIVAFAFGLITLKKKDWRWGVGGMGFIGLAVLYFWILLEGLSQSF